jgi:MFS family permease
VTTEAGDRAALPRLAAWRLLGLAVVAQVGTSVIDQGLPTLTGFVKMDLGISAAAAALATSSAAFGKFLGSYAAGVTADRIGERRVIVAGGIGAGALVALAALLPVPWIFLAIVLGGVAGATSTPAGGRLVLLAFPRNRHGIALSVRQTGIPAGGLVAAALLPWIAESWGWRWSLAAAGGCAALGVLPIARRRFDVEPREPPAARPRGGGAIRDRNVLLLTAWGCLVVSGQFALVAFLALDLHRRAGFGLARGSVLVAVANAAGIAGRIAWGAISDRAVSHGRKPLLVLLNALCFGSALLLLAVPGSAPFPVFVAVAVVAGLGLIGWQGLWITMLAEAAGRDRVGSATGFAGTFTIGMSAVAPTLFGLLADVSGTYRSIWVALSIVLVLAFVPAFAIRESA